MIHNAHVTILLHIKELLYSLPTLTAVVG